MVLVRPCDGPDPPDLARCPWRPVPGPADREHFFAAQARNRRTTWRLTALCLFGVVLMGIPISVVITPLLFTALLLTLDLITLVVPVPDFGLFLAHADHSSATSNISDFWVGILMAIALIGPGALAMALTWIGTRGLFERAGAETLARALGGRPPRMDDLEEQQLSNVVAEMAIAAGVTPPRVMLLDGATANAAALGSSYDDAVVLVSRRMLDELDRDETQGVVAHLVAAIGNGDMRVALSMLSLFRTIALLMTVLGAALGPASRRALMQLMRLGLRRGPGASADEAAKVDELLAAAADLNANDADQGSATKPTTLLDLLRFPLMIAHLAIWMCRLAFMSFVVAPLLALLWRSRRHLADSTAVQLTRNPDGLARALASLSAKGGPIPGASWAAPLFIVGSGPGRTGRPGQTGAKRGILSDDLGLLSFDPPIGGRMHRLRRQGASVDLAFAPSRMSRAAICCLALLVVAVGVALMGCALMVTGIALVIDMLLLTPLLAVVHLVLHGWLR